MISHITEIINTAITMYCASVWCIVMAGWLINSWIQKYTLV